MKRNGSAGGNRWLVEQFMIHDSPNFTISKKEIKNHLGRNWHKRMYDIKQMGIMIVEMFIKGEFHYYCMYMPYYIELIGKHRVSSGNFTKQQIADRKTFHELCNRITTDDSGHTFTTRPVKKKSIWQKIGDYLYNLFFFTDDN